MNEEEFGDLVNRVGFDLQKDQWKETFRLVNEAGKLADERIKKLEAALDRDKTGLGSALAAICQEVKGRRWISEGRGPYPYDDDRYRKETRFAFDAIEKLAVDALSASGKLAHEVLTGKNCPDWCDNPQHADRVCAACKFDGNTELKEYASMSRSFRMTDKGWICSRCP